MGKEDFQQSAGQDYVSRVKRRVEEESDAIKRIAGLKDVALSAEKHFKRLLKPRKRYQQARDFQDDLSAAYERRVLLVLLYEIVDHSYMTLNLLDFEALKLRASGDGHGLAGDSAAEVVSVLELLNEQCKRVMALEAELDLKVNFSFPLDEKEDITFTQTPHWQGFAPGLLGRSFYAYFGSAQESIVRRIRQQPGFWNEQTVGRYLERKGYDSLVGMIGRLRRFDFPNYD